MRVHGIIGIRFAGRNLAGILCSWSVIPAYQRSPAHVLIVAESLVCIACFVSYSRESEGSRKRWKGCRKGNGFVSGEVGGRGKVSWRETLRLRWSGGGVYYIIAPRSREFDTHVPHQSRGERGSK